MSGNDNSRIRIGDLRPSDVALLSQVANEAAKAAVAEVLTAMGLDPKEPFAAQKDMMWLRSTRERCEGATGKALLTAIGVFVVGAIAVWWSGFKALFPGGHP